MFRKEQVDRELDEELRAYQEMAAEKKMKDGLSRKDAVRTENSVQSENAEIMTIRETISLPMRNSLFVALLALIASGFRTRAALQAEVLALRHQLAVL